LGLLAPVRLDKFFEILFLHAYVPIYPNKLIRWNCPILDVEIGRPGGNPKTICDFFYFEQAFHDALPTLPYRSITHLVLIYSTDCVNLSSVFLTQVALTRQKRLLCAKPFTTINIMNMMKIFKQWGSAVRERRKKQKASQQEYAEKMNVAQTFISQIERGERVPSLELAERICKDLNLDFKPLQNAIIVRKLDIVPDPNKIQIHSYIKIIDDLTSKKIALARKKEELAREEAEIAKEEAELSKEKTDSSTNRLKKLSNVK